MIASAELHTCIHKAWEDSSLNASFQALWPSTVNPLLWSILLDDEGAPGQPWPYCIVEIENLSVNERMTGKDDTKREIRSSQVVFNIYAEANTTKSAKQNAYDLAEEIQKVYGGHYRYPPSADLTFTTGNLLLLQYDSDHGINQEQDKYQCVLTYNVLIDFPVALVL
jgi:hypothetical protein